MFAAAAVSGSFSMSSSASAFAAECVNNDLRDQQAIARKLPDCRAYEQVSPSDKNATDALGYPGATQASESGSSLTYFSTSPFPGSEGAAEFPTYVATRHETGPEPAWSNQGLIPPSSPSSTTSVAGVSQDLALAIVVGQEPLLTADAVPGVTNYYERSIPTNSYSFLAQGPAEAFFVGASENDSRVFFETEQPLVEGAAVGVPNLYEAHSGQVRNIGLLPNGAPPVGGAVAGAGGPALEGEQPGGATRHLYTEHAVSRDGSRIFFSDVGTGQIYVLRAGTPALEITATQRNSAQPEERPAYWRDATPDGRYAFFTSAAELTDDSKASDGHPDLYRYDTDTGALRDLTHASIEGANVLGVLGTSADGSYVYFAAGAALASGAAENQPNLYIWHESAVPDVGLVTVLAETPFLAESSDSANWSDRVNGGEPGGPAGGGKSSRVSSDGTTLLFSSQVPQTGYNNGEQYEFYLFDAITRKTVCVSCNPAGLVAIDPARLTHGSSVSSPAARNAILTRNLSQPGDQVFFETDEALVSQDGNDQADVYEWERGGAGTCDPGAIAFVASSGGCLYLLSSGQSSDSSYFGDASPDGANVYLFTRDRLVATDRDNNRDVYDARIGGGIQAQNNPPAVPSCIAESCRMPQTEPPAFASPPSAALADEGNLALPPVLTHPPVHRPTSAQILHKALKACHRLAKRKRAQCQVRARRNYRRSVNSARAGHPRERRPNP